MIGKKLEKQGTEVPEKKNSQQEHHHVPNMRGTLSKHVYMPGQGPTHAMCVHNSTLTTGFATRACALRELAKYLCLYIWGIASANPQCERKSLSCIVRLGDRSTRCPDSSEHTHKKIITSQTSISRYCNFKNFLFF